MQEGACYFSIVSVWQHQRPRQLFQLSQNRKTWTHARLTCSWLLGLGVLSSVSVPLPQPEPEPVFFSLCSKFLCSPSQLPFHHSCVPPKACGASLGLVYHSSPLPPQGRRIAILEHWYHIFNFSLCDTVEVVTNCRNSNAQGKQEQRILLHLSFYLSRSLSPSLPVPLFQA